MHGYVRADGSLIRRKNYRICDKPRHNWISYDLDVALHQIGIGWPTGPRCAYKKCDPVLQNLSLASRISFEEPAKAREALA